LTTKKKKKKTKNRRRKEGRKEGVNECCTGMNSTPNSEFWHLILESFKLLLPLLLLHEAPDLESRLENESIVSETATTKQRNFLKIESKQASATTDLEDRNRNVFCGMHALTRKTEVVGRKTNNNCQRLGKQGRQASLVKSQSCLVKKEGEITIFYQLKVKVSVGRIQCAKP
jgi:hypothetical protein